MFEVHLLNEEGIKKAKQLEQDYKDLHKKITEAAYGDQESLKISGSREFSLAATHLEISSFYAKRAMAMRKENQVDTENVG